MTSFRKQKQKSGEDKWSWKKAGKKISQKTGLM